MDVGLQQVDGLEGDIDVVLHGDHANGLVKPLVTYWTSLLRNVHGV